MSFVSGPAALIAEILKTTRQTQTQISEKMFYCRFNSAGVLRGPDRVWTWVLVWSPAGLESRVQSPAGSSDGTEGDAVLGFLSNEFMFYDEKFKVRKLQFHKICNFATKTKFFTRKGSA